MTATPTIPWDDLMATYQSGDSLCWDDALYEHVSWEQTKRNFTYGLVTRLGVTDIKLDVTDKKQLGFNTYEVPSGAPFEAEFRLWYGPENERPAEIRFFSLLDEQQLDIFPGNQYYYDLTIPAGSEMSIPLAIPSLSSGIHDLVILGIAYPDEYPVPEGSVMVLAFRITLAASPTTEMFRQINFTELPAQALLSRGAPMIPLLLRLSDDNELKVWNWPSRWLDIETDELEFLVSAGFTYTTNLDAPSLAQPEHSFFALTLFKDYRQINIDADVPVMYGKVSHDTAYTNHAIKLTGLQPGMHHILALRIDHPGIPMCILHGAPDGRMLPYSTNGILVGINVLE
jgi:hypothetical protein